MFKGLYWSCRQVKDEMHYECTQKIESMGTVTATSGALNLGLILYGKFEGVSEVIAAVFREKGLIYHMPIVRLAELPLEILAIVTGNRNTTRSSVQRKILRFSMQCCLGISQSEVVRVPTVQFYHKKVVQTAEARLEICRFEEAKN
jgi:hypothetical protein